MSLESHTGGVSNDTPPGESRWKSDLIPGAISIAVGIGVYIYAQTMPRIAEGRPGPGLFPSVIAGFLIVLGTILVIRGVRLKVGKLNASVEEPVAGDAEEVLPTAQRWLNPVGILGAIVFYVVFAKILGFVLTMAILIAGLMRFLKAKWWVSLVTAVALTTVLFLVFQTLLLVRLPPGLLG